MSPFRWLLPLCLTALLWAFSFGANATLASLWLEQAGFNNTIIGLNTTAYYLGIALAAILVPWAMQRFGAATLWLGLILSAVTAAAFPWGGGLVGWFPLRMLNGAAGALSLIPLETFVNRQSTPERRARNFGFYAVAVAGGIALGDGLALQLAPSQPRLAFVLGGLASLAALVVALCWRPRMGGTAEEVLGNQPLAFGRHFLAFGSGWTQGITEGIMVALLPLYLLATGRNNDTVTFLMGGLMLGVVLAQVPAAWLADRLGRTTVLLGCHAITILGALCLMAPGNLPWLAFWLFAVGACSGATYPLGMALLGERTPAPALGRASAWFLAINCLGSQIGPLVAGAAVDRFGPNALFPVGAIAVGLVLVGSAWSATWYRGQPLAVIPVDATGTQSPKRAA
jgi:MFS family permease